MVNLTFEPAGLTLRSNGQGRYSLYSRHTLGPKSKTPGRHVERVVAHTMTLDVALARVIELWPDNLPDDIRDLAALRDAILSIKAQLATFLTLSPRV